MGPGTHRAPARSGALDRPPLARYRLARLTNLDRATGRVIRRYERAKPGELVHVDIKKRGNIRRSP
ncbi:hypothetical protein QFZ68_000170 [Streptomyces sp. V1I6]|nr:hypothetical protein [Streptomyces sp. V1I6]